MFQTIFLHDYRKPLAYRKASRKFCGPYQWTPSKPGTGRWFYMGKGLTVGDSTFRLRIEDANECLPPGSRLRFINGYYTDDDSCLSDTLKPIIARLPHGRGFLAGWTMGEGMSSCVDAHIWETEEEAARAAHDMAERDAEKEREYQAQQRELEEEEED
jgi:hypothetical protein